MPTISPEEYDEILSRMQRKEPKKAPEPKRSIAKGVLKLPEYRTKTEARYAERLEARRLAGEIRAWWYEKLTWKLADDCRLTIDFLVLNNNDTLQGDEVKGGFIREDSMIKLRNAAEQIPWPIYLCQWSDNQWTIKLIGR